jgi:hypothetical protein
MDLKGISILFHEAGPVHALGHDRWFEEWRRGLLMGHLEKQQVGQLLHIVSVTNTVI